MWRRTAASLVGLGLLGLGSAAVGQESKKVASPSQPMPVVQTPARLIESPAPPLAGPAPQQERIRPVANWERGPLSTIQLTVMNQAGMDSRTQEASTYDLILEPPGRLQVFRLDTEAQFKERVRQQGRGRTPPDPVEFPEVPIVSTERYTPGRNWEPLCHLVEPNYVCHDKLLFEEKNSERYGWDLGFIQPFVSAGAFYWDSFFLPYHCFTAPGRPECSAGYRLPGDPVPYLLYPPELSVTGMWAQASWMLFAYKIYPDQQAFPPALRISGSPTEGSTAVGGFPPFGR